MKDMLKVELEDHFRPEFLNRLDEMIVFRKLTHDDLVQIVDLELDKLAKRMAGKGIELEVSTEAKDFLIEQGTDEKFGARPLRRAIEHHLEDPLSESMLRREFESKNKVIVTVNQPASDDEKVRLQLEGVTVETPGEQPEPLVAGHTEET